MSEPTLEPMTFSRAVQINMRILDKITRCQAGFDNATPIGDGTWKRCNLCGGIFWHERYDGR